MKIFVDASLLIYLNVKLPENEARLVEQFWLDLLLNHDIYTNILVLDETIYISKKKYDVPVTETIEFIDRAVVPYIEILPIGLDEYLKAREYMTKYGLKPSDAIHLATIEVNGLQAIASEDKDFDKTHVKRLWIY
ncbi:type II toxin-antitoxin system VapC family toxin [Desulfurococcaceae archaeon MEX13E-LK6-19]|nr:type II toxin-antitoxin system VapC family toxin [Desulfurococcaceae archaeon MEX13E-LK6-19]